MMLCVSYKVNGEQRENIGKRKPVYQKQGQNLYQWLSLVNEEKTTKYLKSLETLVN